MSDVHHQPRRLGQLERVEALGGRSTDHPGDDAFKIAGSLDFAKGVEGGFELARSNGGLTPFCMRGRGGEAHLEPTVAVDAPLGAGAAVASRLVEIPEPITGHTLAKLEHDAIEAVILGGSERLQERGLTLALALDDA